LDHSIEAHVHGPLQLASDVTAIVADPSFRATAIGDLLEQTARRYGLQLGWNPGFQLSTIQIPAEFRGPAIPPLGQRIATNFARGSDVLNAEIIGRAARSVVTDPAYWKDWAPPAETLQHIKQLWHTLVRYGTAILPTATSVKAPVEPP
jgi:hypothetical protein